MLHVTNGDHAAGKILQARLGGQVVPWRDVLHEGPVPEGLADDALAERRARFIAGEGWEDYGLARARIDWRDVTLAEAPDHDEVVLWFEHDLYDQLQLIQVLERLARIAGERVRLSLIVVDEALGPLDPPRLRELFGLRVPVSPAQLEVAREVWAAFRAPEPSAIERLAERDTSALPFLAGTLRRYLQQFPSTGNGLSRSEIQILEALADGARTLRDAFQASNDAREEAVFLGDIVWASYLTGLSRGAGPLVLFDDGTAVARPAARDRSAFWSRRVQLTDAGRAALAGDLDWVRHAGIDRWLGGVHLRGHGPVWRWDEATRRLSMR